MNYIIYGANSAIGSQLARTVIDDADKLVLFYHENKGRIQELSLYDKVQMVQSDVKDFDDLTIKMQSVTDCFQERDKPLSAVYLPAIRSHDHKSLSTTSLDLARDIIDVNLMGAIHFLKALLMIAPADAVTRIVLLGSNVSRTGLKNGSVYSATKAALSNLVRSVSMESGQDKVLINIVSPGPVDTDISGFSDDYIRFRHEYFETQMRLSSLNKIASVSEVCSIIGYLTSHENTHITGEEIFLTGGGL